jgi:hypothetical protein
MADKGDLLSTVIAEVGAAAQRDGLVRPGDARWDAETRTLHIEARGRAIDPDTGAVRGDAPAGPRLVYGTGPHLAASLPRAERFRDSGGYLTDFCRAHEAEAIADALIAHWEELGHCRDIRIAYLWRRKKQAKNGKVVLGTCQKLSGIPKTFLEADWAITLNAENCRNAQLTRYQLEALIYHELSHIAPADDEEDEDAEPTLCGHDVEMFHSEIRRYGLWKSDLAATADAFEQLRLFGGER